MSEAVVVIGLLIVGGILHIFLIESIAERKVREADRRQRVRKGLGME